MAECVLFFETTRIPKYNSRGKLDSRGPFGGGWILPDLRAYAVLRVYHDRGSLWALLGTEPSPEPSLSRRKIVVPAKLEIPPHEISSPVLLSESEAERVKIEVFHIYPAQDSKATQEVAK